MNWLRDHNWRRTLGCVLPFAATIGIGVMVIVDARLPSAFTTLFFIPIILVAYRYPLAVALVLTGIASLFSSPAMWLFGVDIDEAVMPVLWLGWPAVYLFLAVTLNQWTSLGQQRAQLDATERHLMEVQARNEKREQELATLSSIHATILSGGDEPSVVGEITRRVAEVTAAKICSIVVPTGTGTERPLLPTGFTEDVFDRIFPDGAPFGEGVAGWAMLHKRPAASRNVFQDPRYDALREFNAAYEGTKTPVEDIHLEYQALLAANPALTL